MTDKAKDLASKMYDFIVDLANGKIDYTTAERAIEDLERKFKQIHGRAYHQMMGYQTLPAFIYQRWD